MNRLRILLQYDAGKYIHLAIVSILAILSEISYIAIILLVGELYFLWKNSKRLTLAALLLIMVIGFRSAAMDVEYPAGQFTEEGKVGEVFNDSFYLEAATRILVYYDDSEELKPGMIVQVAGYFSRIESLDIMNTFDYPTYLKSKGVTAVAGADSVIIVGDTFSLLELRYLVAGYIDRTFSADEATYIKLFILGMNDTEDEMRLVETRLGITHLFAISGMHLGLLVGFIHAILTRVRLREDRVRLVIIGFLVFYNILTGFRISLLRASLLVTGVYLKDFLGLMLSRADILAFIMIGFIIVNPYYLYSLGFQLSFLVAFTLILGKSLIGDGNLVAKTVKTTLIATAVGLPLTLGMNQGLGLAFIYANLFFILYIGYLFLPASVLIILIPALSPLYRMVVSVFESTLVFFDDINQLIDLSFPNALYKTLFWFGLLWIFLNHQNRKRVITGALVIVLVIASAYILNFESRIFVRFLDVGQGDSIHIHDQGCDCLIDTGDVDSHDNLVEYLRSYNLNHLDYLVISHFHADHYGELADIRSGLTVDHILVSHDTDIISSGYEIVETGDSFTCGEARFQVLSANHDYSNENNNSLVLYALIGGQRYLFTGDAEQEVEQKLVAKYDFGVDVLKVGHHGSATATSQEMLTMIQPRLAVISVGLNNIYGFPDSGVLTRLENMGTSIYRTDISGTITIYYYPILRLRIIETYEKQRLRRYVPSFV